MNVEQLKDYISKVVRSEVRNVIRQEMGSYLTEIFSGKSPSSNILDESINDTETTIREIAPPTPKKFVQYTKNKILNDILNETTGGVPQEGGLMNMMGMGNFGGGGTELLNEVNSPTVSVPASAPPQVKKVAAVINRDFSALMKRIDKKVAEKNNK